MNNDQIERPVDRRLLLRGGAILAGAAGATVVGAAIGSPRAEAAPVNYLVAGQQNATTETTGLTIDGSTGGVAPALSLTNASGPSLKLVPAGDNYNGGLQPGEIANTDDGPEIGIDVDNVVQTTWLATGLDLDAIPVVLPIPPERLVDTRSSSGRGNIRSTSANAFDSSHRLKAGAFMDVALAPSDLFGLQGAYINVTAVQPLDGGYLSVYPPGDRPTVSTLNFAKSHNVANGAFILTGIADSDPKWFVVRVFSTATLHVIVDLTGVTLLGTSGVVNSRRGTLSQRRAVEDNRMKRVFR